MGRRTPKRDRRQGSGKGPARSRFDEYSAQHRGGEWEVFGERSGAVLGDRARISPGVRGVFGCFGGEEAGHAGTNRDREGKPRADCADANGNVAEIFGTE